MSGKVQHESHQTPASGDTNSRKWLQVAGIQGAFLFPPQVFLSSHVLQANEQAEADGVMNRASTARLKLPCCANQMKPA
jgi:hypothetical protein